jgi:hypothetical protein
MMEHLRSWWVGLPIAMAWICALMIVLGSDENWNPPTILARIAFHSTTALVVIWVCAKLWELIPEYLKGIRRVE